MKKVVNIVTLLIMTSVNIMNPFVFAADDVVEGILNVTQNVDETPGEDKTPDETETLRG